ncbi:hypothetical protein Tco_0364427 [Tanacetum coccineum]
MSACSALYNQRISALIHLLLDEGNWCSLRCRSGNLVDWEFNLPRRGSSSALWNQVNLERLNTSTTKSFPTFVPELRMVLLGERDDMNTPDLMNEKIRNMVSQEVAKAQQASLPHLYDNISDTINKIIQEELRKIRAGETSPMLSAFNYRDFSACNPPYYIGEQNPFKCYRWLQDMEEVYTTCGCPKNLRVTLIGNQLRERAKEWWGFLKQSKVKKIRRDFLSTPQTYQSIHDFTMTFLDRTRFCPEYFGNEKMLMEHYVDMLKKEIREFISARNWKNFDEVMNAALEYEQDTKKGVNRTYLKRRVDQSGPSAKRQRFGGDFSSGSHRIQRMDNPQCTQCGKYHPDDDVVVLENSETEEEDVKEDESDHNKERYTFEDDDDDGNLTT